MIDFRFNYPLSKTQHDILTGVFTDVTAEEANFRMAPVGGADDDREIAASWLSRPGHEISAGNIYIAGGGHNAMTSILLGTRLSGKVVVTDSIIYNGFKALAGMLNVTLVPCPFDHEGMLPDVLEGICSQTDVKAIYLMPTIHNPLCIVMPEKRRLEIVEVARKFDLILIDDDAYGFLEEQPPLSFAHLAPERSFYIYSFAKPLAAGLKSSYIVAPSQWHNDLIEGIRISCSGASTLMTKLIGKLIASGSADRIIEEKRAEGALRQKIVSEILTGQAYISHKNSFHLWVSLTPDINVTAFESELKNAGVEVVTSLAYQVENDPGNNGFRVSLGNVESHSQIRTGLEIIAEALRKC